MAGSGSAKVYTDHSALLTILKGVQQPGDSVRGTLGYTIRKLV